MENIFLVKLPANVNQRKHIHNNFLSEVSHVLNYTFFFRRMNKGVESLRTNIMKALLTVVTFAVTFHSIYSGRRL